MTLNDFLALTRRELETELRRTFEASASQPLTEAIHYSLLAGGKRLRPALVRAAAELVNAPSDRWLIPAQALEMIHVYSLIHDDLPAMDDDDLRRGKPTSHRQFGEATAILAGDALQTEAFRLIAEAESLSAEQVRSMIRILANSAGASGMVGGQMIDLASEHQALNLEELSRLHHLKTGALIIGALRLGALCSNEIPAQTEALLIQYGQALGLAFQITDDVLDVTGKTEVLGKPSGSDLAAEKSTYVRLLGVEGARSAAQQQIETARQALQALQQDETSLLWQLADYVITRDH